MIIDPVVKIQNSFRCIYLPIVDGTQDSGTYITMYRDRQRVILEKCFCIGFGTILVGASNALLAADGCRAWKTLCNSRPVDGGCCLTAKTGLRLSFFLYRRDYEYVDHLVHPDKNPSAWTSSMLNALLHVWVLYSFTSAYDYVCMRYI